MSGGIDSAVTAALAADALGPENVLGVIMPSPYTPDHAVKDALELARNLGIEQRLLPIDGLFHSFLQLLNPEGGCRGRPGRREPAGPDQGKYSHVYSQPGKIYASDHGKQVGTGRRLLHHVR